jgi:hypothetical protein
MHCCAAARSSAPVGTAMLGGWVASDTARLADATAAGPGAAPRA